MDNKFSDDINWFQKHIDSRRRMLPLFTSLAGKMASRVQTDLFEFVNQHGRDIERDEDGDPTRFKVPVEFSSQYKKIRGMHNDSSVFFVLLPRMTFISLVSIYDAYLSRLLKLVFELKPEILNGSERQFSFKDINSYESFDEMKEAIIDSEIESFLRKSHAEQFKWLENKLGSSGKKISLKSGLDKWGDFIELTERRNLLVHNDGIINKHYIKLCTEHGLKPNKNVGEQLDIDSDYYQDACNCIFEIGVKLGHVLWRKLMPTKESCTKADDNLVELIFNLLVSKDYDLAIRICGLAEFQSFKIATQQSLFFIKINHAIAHKGLEQQDKCTEILDQIDFTPLSDIFKIANFVLREQNEEAAQLMRKLAKSEDFQENFYKNWPLFQWFIKTDEFNETYEEIYGEQFTIKGDTSEPDSTS
ncbi:hypothetical protein J6I92_08150 [Pseudidiomarina sp. 1APR75-15]|uniref:Apea-like HEPN domain-containing protein n=1 Tax=Pseudidiomarina terrestris TaxID=2820060 RepID=A0ABT8MIR8_9GAMM|nr:hypothetical protein [Pseudidiomarina sp. 1APR75-15]MDN7129841.1 hypothetical protein [Pseudidiomarina sp. 1APR75-15]